MAIFNPAIPETNDPNYLNLSKSITTPEADKSTGIAIGKIGQIGESAIKASDEVVKSELDADIHTAVDKERDQYRGSLEYAQTQLAENRQQQLLPGADANNGQPVPPDLKALPGQVSALSGARANGHVSETYYYGRLDALAKDFRSRYPGYRDYIDQQISNITGVTPANAYIKSIIGDINAAQTGQKAELEKTLNDLRDHGVNKGNPEAAALYDYVKRTGDISLANQQITKWNARSWKLQQMEEEQKNVNMTDTERKRAATQSFDLAFSSLQDQHWSGIQRGLGLNYPSQINQLVNKVVAGEVQPLPPPQKEALLGQLTASRAALEQAMIDKVNKNYEYTYTDLNGQEQKGWTSMAEQLGGQDAANAKIKASLRNWDIATDLITNDKYGLYASTKRMNEAILDEAQHGLLTDKTLGPWLQNLAAMNKIAPQYVEKYFASLLASDIDQSYKPYIQKQISNMLAQPQYAESGIAATFKKTMEDAQNKGIAMPQVYNEYVKSLEPLWRNNMPGVPAHELEALRHNLAIAAFHPDNIGVLKSVQDDHWENGVHHPGAQTVYQRFGQQDAVNNMRKLTDPVHWENYVAFMGSEYTQMAKKDILNLNDLTKNFPNVFYTSWDQDKHEWRLHQVGDTTGRDILNDKNFVPNKTQIGMAGLDDQFKQVQTSMKRLNMITKPLVNVTTADGGDANAAVIQHMITSGLKIDPNKPPQGLPEQMLHNLVKQREAVTPATSWWEQPGAGSEQMTPVAPLQYQSEDQRGGLKPYLQDPGAATRGIGNNAPRAISRPPRGISNRQEDIATGPPIDIPNERTPETERMMRGLPPR